MAKGKHKPTDDAVEILHRRLVDDDPEKLAELEKIRADNDVARKIYDLRTKAGLSHLRKDFPQDRKPNQVTLDAMRESKEGKGMKCESMEDFWEKMGVHLVRIGSHSELF